MSAAPNLAITKAHVFGAPSVARRYVSMRVLIFTTPKGTLQDLYKSISLTLNTEAVACNFIEKETLAQVFSCEFYEIFKNNFFYRITPVAAPVNKNMFSYLMFFAQNHWSCNE